MGFGFCTGYQKVKRFIDVLRRIAHFLQKTEEGGIHQSITKHSYNRKHQPSTTVTTPSRQVKISPAFLTIYRKFCDFI